MTLRFFRGFFFIEKCLGLGLEGGRGDEGEEMSMEGGEEREEENWRKGQYDDREGEGGDGTYLLALRTRWTSSELIRRPRSV